MSIFSNFCTFSSSLIWSPVLLPSPCLSPSQLRFPIHRPHIDCQRRVCTYKEILSECARFNIIRQSRFFDAYEDRPLGFVEALSQKFKRFTCLSAEPFTVLQKVHNSGRNFHGNTVEFHKSFLSFFRNRSCWCSVSTVKYFRASFRATATSRAIFET